MAAPQLSNLYALTGDNIDAVVMETAAGVYVLDKTPTGGFTVSYVGRSDADLNKCLHDHVGNYEFFEYAYCSSPKAAFEAECELYHDYRPPDNIVHPERTTNSGWKCPRCLLFG